MMEISRVGRTASWMGLRRLVRELNDQGRLADIVVMYTYTIPGSIFVYLEVSAHEIPT